jgi:hypothetical protein
MSETNFEDWLGITTTTMAIKTIMLTLPASDVTGERYPITAIVVIMIKNASKKLT